MLNSDRVAGVVFMTGSDWAELFAIIVFTVHIGLDCLPSLYLLYTLGCLICHFVFTMHIGLNYLQLLYLLYTLGGLLGKGSVEKSR